MKKKPDWSMILLYTIIVIGAVVAIVAFIAAIIAWRQEQALKHAQQITDAVMGPVNAMIEGLNNMEW